MDTDFSVHDTLLQGRRHDHNYSLKFTQHWSDRGVKKKNYRTKMIRFVYFRIKLTNMKLFLVFFKKLRKTN